MSLATVIRSEFSYPGAGILAGDSIQYLSIATAHGVIMVFYMIMPLIFGAFGNFLLPTQLGVHDVAFPRLNSAAFWFLPGGLIMLMQLVCVDRVYKRMNCFNIRELQGILKRRFFADLVNSADHRDILSSSMIGLRFKNNNALNLDHDTLSFFKLGTNNSSKSRLSTYSNYYSDFLSSTNSPFTNYGASFSFSALNTHFLYSVMSLANMLFISPIVTFSSLFKVDSYSNFLSLIKTNFGLSLDFFSLFSTRMSVMDSEIGQGSVNYSSTNPFFSLDAKYSLLEHENLSRFSRFSNPTISYDFKCGNYIGI
jgi:hypothetical protein